MTPARFAAAGLRPPSSEDKFFTCKWCCKSSRYTVPRSQDVPLPLLKCTDAVREALRPLHVNVRHKRAQHGYRVHMGPVRFSWKSTPF